MLSFLLGYNAVLRPLPCNGARLCSQVWDSFGSRKHTSSRPMDWTPRIGTGARKQASGTGTFRTLFGRQNLSADGGMTLYPTTNIIVTPCNGSIKCDTGARDHIQTHLQDDHPRSREKDIWARASIPRHDRLERWEACRCVTRGLDSIKVCFQLSRRHSQPTF